ncbi:MAG: hypothetical protein H0X66_06440 [Verrucomicrobia bacterium]|nr:hypothetical protein [Verrucomicrobiota bacterium]
MLLFWLILSGFRMVPGKGDNGVAIAQQGGKNGPIFFRRDGATFLMASASSSVLVVARTLAKPLQMHQRWML